MERGWQVERDWYLTERLFPEEWEEDWTEVKIAEWGFTIFILVMYAKCFKYFTFVYPVSMLNRPLSDQLLVDINSITLNLQSSGASLLQHACIDLPCRDLNISPESPNIHCATPANIKELLSFLYFAIWVSVSPQIQSKSERHKRAQCTTNTALLAY